MSKLVKLTAALLLSVTFANADSSQADAKALVEKGVEFCKKVGVAACVEEFNKPESQFVKDDLYIWANDFDGIITAHPKKPLKGKNMYRYKDRAGNQLFKIFIDKVNTPDYETLKNLIDEDCVIEYQNKFRTVRNVDILKAFGEHHMEVYVK